jgi:hypothetical protein
MLVVTLVQRGEGQVCMQLLVGWLIQRVVLDDIEASST